MKDLKTCKYCKTEYYGRGKSFCSKDCFYKSQRKEKIVKPRKPLKERNDCAFCGNRCKRVDVKFCSKECYAKFRIGKPGALTGRKQSEETIRKRVENTDQKRKEAKRKETMLDKYGVDNPTKIEGVTDKIAAKIRGLKRPRIEGQQEAIIESKRMNGSLNHSEETKKKISESLKKKFSDPDFDRSVFVNSGSNGKNSKTGYYNGLYYRSSYEEMFIRFCEHYNIKVESAANKKHCIKYLASDGEIRSYYPDFYLPELNTTVEIKPISMYDVGENQNKFMAAYENVTNYVVLSELDGFICENEWEEFYEVDVKYWS